MMENADKKKFEKIYEKPRAVWTRQSSPKEIKELVETGKIKPCKVIDIGCGEGIHSIYLAKKGFDVMGIDLSENAIEYAKQNAKDAKVDVRFMAMDITNLNKINEKFDFVLEWAVMHHINSKQRQKYIEDVNNILNKDGKYLSVSFNKQSSIFGKVGGKIRNSGKSAPGLKIYFSSQEELENLFKPTFKIFKTQIIKRIEGTGPHIWNYSFMGKNE